MTAVPLDHLLSRKKPITKTVVVALDPELAEAYAEAKLSRDVANTRATARPTDTDVQAELWRCEQALVELEERMVGEEAIAYFTFRCIGRAAYDALVDAHQPTPAQRAEAKARGVGEIAWNPDTFPPALIAACLTEPSLTEADVTSMFNSENWNQAELNDLLQAAAQVNGTRRTVEVGKDWPRTLRSGPSSTTASSGASPTASS